MTQGGDGTDLVHSPATDAQTHVTALYSPPFIFENDFPIQKCQFFKVDFYIPICLWFYHGLETKNCPLADFVFKDL